jgi:hypothetical protein
MRAALGHEYDYAWLLAEIVDGYYRSEMAAARRDDTSRLDLKRRQDGRAREEARFAREAEQPADVRAHRRRADKASYLRDKLAEAERSEERAGND